MSGHRPFFLCGQKDHLNDAAHLIALVVGYDDARSAGNLLASARDTFLDVIVGLLLFPWALTLRLC